MDDDLTGITGAATLAHTMADVPAKRDYRGHSPAANCLNCGAALAHGANFCSYCGQDTANHPPSLFEFVHEFISHYIAAEGKVWKSLWGLMAKPGFLTSEYLAGRKQRYVMPLRLILTLGLVFFLVVKFAPVQLVKVNTGAINRAEVPVQIDPDTVAKLPPGLRAAIERVNQQWHADRRGMARAMGSTMLSLAPYAVLCSLPFFAGLLKLLFWRQRYGAHFVFAMHLHAAWYGMLLMGALLPWDLVVFGLWAWSNIYPVVALKRVHVTGWGATLLRSAALAALHWLVIALGVVGLLLAGVLVTA